MHTKQVALLVLLAAALITTTTANAAPICFGGSCNWMINGNFSNITGWTYSGTTFPSPNDPCLFGAPPNKLAELGTNHWLQSPTLFIDSSYYVAVDHFEVAFNLYLLNDTNNWWDQLTIQVKNTTTGQVETFYISGDQYTTSCTKVKLTLANDYSDSNVEVKFKNSYLALGQWQIDNVAFWSKP